MAKKRLKSNIINLKWESNNLCGGRFIKICFDMMSSMAWKELSVRQRGLYLEIKKQFTRRSDGSNNFEEIYILYKDFDRDYSSKNTLMKDVDALIEYGFIRVINAGKFARLPNIYGFSDKWKIYNTKEFIIHPGEKRMTKHNTFLE